MQIPSWSCQHDRATVERTHLETSGTPIDKLDSPLCSNVADGGVDVLGHDISSEEQTTGHILALPGVALDHLIVAFETRDRHFRDRVGLVEGLSQQYPVERITHLFRPR